MIWSAFKLSLLVVSLATVIVSIAGTALGFLLARRDFWGKELCDSLITLPMVLPPTVTGYYLILLLGRRGLVGRYIFRPDGLDGGLHLGSGHDRRGRDGAAPDGEVGAGGA